MSAPIARLLLVLTCLSFPTICACDNKDDVITHFQDREATDLIKLP